MSVKNVFILTSFLYLNSCQVKIDANSIYGEYSLVIDEIQHILIISRGGTYVQKRIIGGELVSVNRQIWRDYTPDDNDFRYSLQNFEFPSRKSSGEWHAQLKTRWGKLSLCYFDDGAVAECYTR